MRQRRIAGTVILVLLLVTVPFLLGSGGCGGSGGSGSSSITNNDTTVAVASDRSAAGNAVVNPLLVGSTVTAKDANNRDITFTPASVTTTGLDGGYALRWYVDSSGNLVTDGSAAYEVLFPVIITISGGNAVDGSASTPFAGSVKTILKDPPSVTRTTVNVYASTLTTLAAEIYEALPKSGKTGAELLTMVDQVKTTVSNLVALDSNGTTLSSLGIDIFSSPPVPKDAASLTKAQQYRYANDFIAVMVSDKMASVAVTSAAYSRYVAAVAADLTDGSWDGRTASSVTAPAELAALVDSAGGQAGFSAWKNTQADRVTNEGVGGKSFNNYVNDSLSVESVRTATASLTIDSNVTRNIVPQANTSTTAAASLPSKVSIVDTK